jgi:hypothetical protein
MQFNHITPEYLSTYVNFFYGKGDWYYRNDGEENMAKLQAEGAAKIWNLLLEKEIALLADEVGTGKTIQALAVLMTLWKQKPNAKVLLYSPNDNVSRKWVREYNNFIRSHYRTEDDNIKSSITGEPLRNALYSENHADFMRSANQIWPSFFIGKISSLSNFLSPKMNQGFLDEVGIKLIKPESIENADEKDQIQWMQRLAVESNKKLYKLLQNGDEPPFDLLIIDEAHYLRRTDGHSNRSIVANAFFQRRDIYSKDNAANFPLAKKVLLLTATPNHTAAQDINNIIGLFKPEYARKKSESILEEICVRRFRRLQGKTKFQYREELPMPVALNDLREKLFFAAYQKNLVQHQANKADKDKKDNPYRILFGYLEGLEFIPKKKEQQTTTKGKKEDSEEKSTDFKESQDSEALKELVAKYRAVYREAPRHPKYLKVIEELSPDVTNPCYCKEKTLVFVRRIPSVFEISRRLLEVYDQWLLNILGEAFPHLIKKKNRGINLRKHFYDLVQDKREEEEAPLEKTDIKSDVTIPESQILDLFVKKPDKRFRSTDCSNFRLRFSVNTQIFSAFFQPASDYALGTYRLPKICYIEDAGKRKIKYRNSFILERLDNIHDEGMVTQLKRLYTIDDEIEVQREEYNLRTLIGMWWNCEATGDLQKKMIRAKQEYNNWTVLEREGFAGYLEKGVLLSSPFVVHLYTIYRKVLTGKNGTKRGEKLYELFCDEVAKRMVDIGLASLITEAVLSFQFFYQKELGISEQKLGSEKWNFFNATLPVFPYCGDTQRESIIKAFNTPFFPNVLVATSVLQEGVDLHLHCSKVIHYF